MADELDIAMVTAACVVWSGSGQIVEVQRYLAISMISSGGLAWSMPLEHASTLVQQAAQEWIAKAQQNPAQATNIDRLLKHNAFFEKREDVVQLRAQQLLTIATQAYGSNPAAYSPGELSACLAPGTMCAKPHTSSLLAHTVSEMYRTNIGSILHTGLALLESQTQNTSLAMETAYSGPMPAARQASGSHTVSRTESVNATQDPSEEHWPSLPSPAPPPAPPPGLKRKPAPPATTSDAPAGSATTTQPTAAAAASSNGTGAAQPSAAEVGVFRSRCGVGYGDDSLLWPALLDTIKDVPEFQELPKVDGDDLLELLALGLAVCTTFQATNGQQMYRQVVALAMVNCPVDIARMNRGRHRCLRAFVEKLTKWTKKRLMDAKVPRADFGDKETYIYEDDPFFFCQGDWMVLLLRQLAAVTVRLADTPPQQHPNLPFPPTLANMEVNMHHNQSKPVYVLLQRLMQPPTRTAFCLAALDVLRRFSAAESTDHVAHLYSVAIKASNEPSHYTPKWPPKPLSLSVDRELQSAAQKHATVASKQKFDELLAEYKMSVAPPPALRVRGAFAGAESSTAGDAAAVAQHGGAGGVVGAEFVDDKTAKGKNKHKKAQQAAPPPPPPPPPVAALVMAADTKPRKAPPPVTVQPVETDTRTLNSFGLLEAVSEEMSHLGTADNNGTPSVHRPTRMSHKELLALAGIYSDDDTDTDTTQTYTPTATQPSPLYQAPPATGTVSPAVTASTVTRPVQPAYNQPVHMASNGTYTGAAYTPAVPTMTYTALPAPAPTTSVYTPLVQPAATSMYAPPVQQPAPTTTVVRPVMDFYTPSTARPPAVPPVVPTAPATAAAPAYQPAALRPVPAATPQYTSPYQPANPYSYTPQPPVYTNPAPAAPSVAYPGQNLYPANTQTYNSNATVVTPSNVAHTTAFPTRPGMVTPAMPPAQTMVTPPVAPTYPKPAMPAVAAASVAKTHEEEVDEFMDLLCN